MNYPTARPWTGAVVAAALCLAACDDGGRRGARNALIVSIDTLRPDMLGAYGYGRPTSPAFDGLASTGALFENVRSTAPWTLPAHGSLVTGLYPRRHGALHEERALDDDVRTLAEELSAAGLSTAAFVNAHFVGSRYGFDRGFESFVELEGKARYKPSEVIGDAMAWLSAHASEPFFLFVHDYQVHSAYSSSRRFERMFAHPYEGTASGETAMLRAVREGTRVLSESDLEHVIDLYVAGIRQMDADLARLLGHLEKLGRGGDTLVVVTSDHGEEFLEHGDVLHGRTQYDEVLRVPLVLRGPGVPAALRVSEPASLVDVMPTILALLDVESDVEFDGLDLTLRWNGGARGRVIFSEADHNNAEPSVLHAAVLGRYKLIHDRLAQRGELFDLVSDPNEQDDIADEQPDLLRRLTEELERFRTGAGRGKALSRLDEATREDLEGLGYF